MGLEEIPELPIRSFEPDLGKLVSNPCKHLGFINYLSMLSCVMLSSASAALGQEARRGGYRGRRTCRARLRRVHTAFKLGGVEIALMREM